MNTPFQHSDEFSATEQHLLLGALYGELSEEEHAVWEHLKQQKPLLADEYTRLKQTTVFLSNNEQISEHQNDTAFFDQQWQTLQAIMREEERATVAPVPISLPSSQPTQAKRTLLFTLPQMQRWYGIAAMLVVAVGLGISVYRWQNTIPTQGSMAKGVREQEVKEQEVKEQEVKEQEVKEQEVKEQEVKEQAVHEQGVKTSPASPSANAQEQAFGTASKSSPLPFRSNTLKGASEQTAPKSTSEPRPEADDADVPRQQLRDAVKRETIPQTPPHEVLKKDAEEAAKERPLERKQAAPQTEVSHPALTQPVQAQPVQAQPAQAETEQTRRKNTTDEARSTAPAPQAAPLLDVLKSLAVPQGGSESGGARQRLDNNLQAAPKRSAPTLPNSQSTPHHAVTSTQPTLRVDSTHFRIKTQDSTRNKR